jgi:hypothetical protein
MQRWGKTAAGRQRFYCPLCLKSSTRRRPDLREKIKLQTFVAWLTETTGLATMAKKLRVSISSLTKSFMPFWEYLPLPKPIIGNSEVLVVDGVSVVKHSLVVLVIFDRLRRSPVSWFYTVRESYSSWLAIFFELKVKGVNPRVIVCDGQKGLIKAIYTIWPEVVIQRCVIHINRQAKSWLTKSPHTDAGKELLQIVKALLRIETQEQKQTWLKSFSQWLVDYDDFLKERTYHSQLAKRWWYTHKKLRAVRSLLKNSLDNLFIYLDDCQVPRTSNDVEGGINSRIKDLLRIHRGLLPHHQQVLTSWYLAKRQGQKPTRNYY